MPLTKVSGTGIKEDSVDHTKLAAGAVNTAALGNGAVTSAKITKPIDFADNEKIRFGTGNDLEIWHSGSHSYIQNTTGQLYIHSNELTLRSTSQEKFIDCSVNGAVELYYDNSKKLATQSVGVDVTGGVYATGTITAGVNIKANTDTGKLAAGASDDLQIYHDGTSSYLSNTTGNLYIESKANQTAIQIVPDGAVDLRHSGNKKFETTSTGVTVTGNVKLPDNGNLYIGDGNDLQIYHNGNVSVIKDAGTGPLGIRGSSIHLQNPAGSEEYAGFTEGGAASFYYDNSKKLETTSTGVTVTGNVNIATGNNVTTGSVVTTSSTALTAVDNGIAYFGTDLDLRIYHNGSDSLIRDQGTGGLYMTGSAVGIRNSAANEDALLFAENGAVQLFFDNSKKFETSSGGAKVYGDLRINDNEHIYFGDGADLEITVGSNNDGVINQVNGDLKFQRGGTGKFTIKSTGTHFSDDAFWADSQKAIFGAGSDLQIYHNGTDSYIQNETNDLFIDNNGDDIVVRTADTIFFQVNNTEDTMQLKANGAVELYFDNSKKFETTSSGITVTGSVTTQDMNMSNLNGSANEVDNTKGSWSIQEGSDDLFIINRVTGKKYKFNLTEIS